MWQDNLVVLIPQYGISFTLYILIITLSSLPIFSHIIPRHSLLPSTTAMRHPHHILSPSNPQDILTKFRPKP